MTEASPRIEGYKVGRLIGRGGMAAVYEAWRQSDGKQVAIKVIAPELATDEEFLARFEREVEAASQLEHEHAARVVDARFDADTGGFLATEFIDGPNLQQRINSQGRLPVAEVLRIVQQIAGALDEAHRLGLVHRDVKPANVLLDESGTAYLSDFGLARDLAATQLTTSGAWLGTVDYAAPEQIRSEGVDARTDVYALAALAFNALTGGVPFPGGDAMATMWSHVHEARPSLSAALFEHAHEASEVIARGMAIDPADRPPSAGDFARALALAAREGATARLPEHSVAKGAAAPSEAATAKLERPRWLRRLAFAAAATVALAAAAAILLTLDPLSSESEPITAASTEATADTAAEEGDEGQPAKDRSDPGSRGQRREPCVATTARGDMVLAHRFRGDVRCAEARETLERYYSGDTDTPAEGSGGGAQVGPFYCLSAPAAIATRGGTCTDEAGGRSFAMDPAALHVARVGVWTYRTTAGVWDRLPFRKMDRAVNLFIENNPNDCGHLDGPGDLYAFVDVLEGSIGGDAGSSTALVSELLLEECKSTRPDQATGSGRRFEPCGDVALGTRDVIGVINVRVRGASCNDALAVGEDWLHHGPEMPGGLYGNGYTCRITTGGAKPEADCFTPHRSSVVRFELDN